MISGISIGITGVPLTYRFGGGSIPDVLLTAPVNLVPPAISGSPKQDEPLTATAGSWSSGGSSISSYDFQWFRNSNVITGATSNAYTPTEDDVGAALSVEVIATNAIGYTAAVSDPTGVVKPADTAPVNTVRPTISGVARSGELLAAANNGEWTGNGDELLDFAYQWLADDVAIPGRTGTTILLTDDQIGQRISLAVHATNSIGTTTATSLKTAAVIAAQFMPAIVEAPEISGTPKVPNVLSVSNGTWNNGGSTITSYTYVWYADDVEIAGATGNTLPLDATLEYAVIRAEVTATNGIGSLTATTTETDPVEPEVIAPVATSVPTLSGIARAGQTMTCVNGDWYDGGEEPTYAYQWFLFSTGEAIDGATSPTYTLLVGQAGDRVYCEVTATNSAGSTPAESAPTSTIGTPAHPENVSAPTISGDLFIDEVLTATTGSWEDSGVEITEFAYQWYHNSSPISGATSSTFTITPTQRGRTLSVKVTATNAGGSASATSTPTEVVSGYTPRPPANTSLPTISGQPYIDKTLTALRGGWNEYFFATTYSYEWLVDGVEAEGATESTFTLTEAHDGLSISVRVTATNDHGAMSATSGAIVVDGYEPLPPVNLTLPTIEGYMFVGFTLEATAGTWEDYGNDITAFEYQWYQDNLPVEGATEPSFVLTESQLGSRMKVSVTVTNKGGSVSATSAVTAVTEPAPPPEAPVAVLNEYIIVREVPPPGQSETMVSTLNEYVIAKEIV